MATNVIGKAPGPRPDEPDETVPETSSTDSVEEPGEPLERRVRWRPDLWWSIAAFVVVAQVLIRWWIALGLDFVQDDVLFIYRALDNPLDAAFLLETYDGHFGPLWKAVQWATVQVAPFDFGVAIATVVVGLILADIGMLLALREIFGRARMSLLLFAFWAFVPLTVVASASWTIGAIMFPVLASMAWTTYFHARVVRGAGVGSAIGAVLCLSLGLLVSPQALFLLPFLVMWTLAFPRLTRVGGLRATVRRARTLWLLYAVVVAAYLVLYRAAGPQRAIRWPTLETLGHVFAEGFLGSALPSTFGGPWGSDPGSWPSFAALGTFATSVLVQLMLLLVVVTVWLRPHAWRAWAALAALVAMVLLVMAVAVHFELTVYALLRQPHYVAIFLVPGTVLLGCTWACGRPRPGARRILRRLPSGLLTAVAVVAGLVFVQSAWVTTQQQATAIKAASSRPFWTNVRAGLDAHPSAVLIDRLMPSNVVFSGFLPEVGATSTALRHFVRDQTFDVPAEEPYVITDEGRVVRGQVAEFARSYPGPVPGCGYVVRRSVVGIPLNQQAFSFSWGVQLNYLAEQDTVIEVGGGGVTRKVPLQRGLHTVTLQLPGELPRIRVQGTQPGVAVCLDQVLVGGIAPRPDPTP